MAAAAPGSAGTVAVAGATGLVGTALVKQLLADGFAVRVLTRNVVSARSKLPYPGLQFVAPQQWSGAVCGCTAVVNLAGEPIATRWTPAIKAEVKRSRVNTTSQLAAAINACPEDQRPVVLVSSSAVGYYGNSESQTFSESSAPGRDYLAEVCREWEAAASTAQARTVVLRTGIVLAKEGGALGRMVPVFSIFAGGPLGSGRQWCSWIHRDDIVGMVLEAIRNDSWQGVYNATAPNPVRMGELCSALGSVMGRPSLVPVPDFALRTLLGEGASVVLEGQRVVPSRAQDAGFKFKYSQVQDALRNVLRA
ncbi:epimerase family SDR39U1 chloroplastic-like isoform X2 [Micractinium conductrix]|uniref:Epimerase family SDR39U1 chloroplastic-like isoform X2 n=1 Tax=Micractinium conductrix TaxID=554055 RepID=A0A2P6UZU4_9CHLO|nr:epimerase family SDR39U1 chloroplastic-like isoform X2 [Micractinium conductrix]|eukprot:PSC67365.1 epimerase family SDR39U1 chloroplastic-like isoform X2 [Micractinium conductrix]